MLVIPVLDCLCLYNENHQIVSVINVPSSIRSFLNAEIKKGYFLTLVDDEGLHQNKMTHVGLETRAPFSFLGTQWLFKVYPSAAYEAS